MIKSFTIQVYKVKYLICFFNDLILIVEQTLKYFHEHISLITERGWE